MVLPHWIGPRQLLGPGLHTPLANGRGVRAGPVVRGLAVLPLMPRPRVQLHWTGRLAQVRRHLSVRVWGSVYVGRGNVRRLHGVLSHGQLYVGHECLPGERGGRGRCGC